MKKFLVILAVMVIAPLASATLGGLVLEVDKPIVGDGYYFASAGDIVTVLVIQTVPNPTGSGGEMGIQFDGVVTEVVNTSANPPAGFWLWGTDFGIKQSDAVGGISFAKIGGLGSGSYGKGSTDLLGNPYVSTVQFSFEYTGERTELVWLGVWDGVDMTGEIGLSLIPEPITLSLLSLGGLFIRQRK